MSNAEGLDVTRAEQYFGFKSKVAFEEGLRRTIEWYQASVESRVSKVKEQHGSKSYERYTIKVVFDASPLITACKFKSQGKLVIDHLLFGCRIVIPPRVEEEVAVLGATYPDGVAAGERIAQELIQVAPVMVQRWAQRLSDYALGSGEKDAIELCGQGEEVVALVTDDYLAFITATRLGLKAWMLPDLVVELVERRKLTSTAAKAILTVIRPRYRLGVIEHSLAQLQEVEQDDESHRAG